MARNPTNVGRAPIDVARVVIEHVLVGHCRINQVAGSCVQYAFWFSGGAGGVKNEERILGTHFFTRAIRIDLVFKVVQPGIAALNPVNVTTGVADYQHFLERRNVRVCSSCIHVRFQRYNLATTKTLVSGNNDV